MEQRRLGRDTWAQFDDPITDLSTGEVGRVDEDSLKDSNIPHVTRAGQLGSSDDHDSSFFPAGPPVDSYGSLSTRKLSGVPFSEAANSAPRSTQFNPSESSATCADPWSISPEQRAYYLSQFLRLQSDPRAKLSGSQAKMFFELSKLSTTELSDIWELSDVDHDGQLTLGEFAVAMHLVVLRRNGVPVPQVLPKTLMDMITTQSLSTLVPTGTAHMDRTDSSYRERDHPHHPHQPITTNATLPTDAGVDASIGAVQTSMNRPWPGSPTCSSVAMTPVSVRQRRWSISSQSDISSLAEGIIHFEARPNADGQLQYPIPVRARTLPSGCSAPHAGHQHHSFDLVTRSRDYPTLLNDSIISSDHADGYLPHGNPSQLSRSPLLPPPPPPPPPPPRAHAVGRRLENTVLATATTTTGGGLVGSNQSWRTTHHVDNISVHRGNFSPPVAPVEKTENLEGDVFLDASRVSLALTESRGDPDSVISQLQRECDEIMQNNDQLTSELMQLQQQRIALKILLERLMPLEATGCPC